MIIVHLMQLLNTLDHNSHDTTLGLVGLRNYIVRKNLAVQTLLWSLKLVIHNEYLHYYG